MDKSASPMTGYGFAKRIIDYYGTHEGMGAGDVLVAQTNNQWCDWLVRYDSFYQNSQEGENKERFDAIIEDICALYNTRGGVVLVGMDGKSDPQRILKNRGLQDYAKVTCDAMCKRSSWLATKEERRRIKKIFEAKIVGCGGREAIALLVKSADTGLRYPIGNDTNRFFVRDGKCGASRPEEGILTANSVVGEAWKREDYLGKEDLSRKLAELKLPTAPPRTASLLSAMRAALRVKITAKSSFSFLIRVSRLGFVVMTLMQFLPIGNEICRPSGELSIASAFKIIVVGIIPVVAPYWAAQGTIHCWGLMPCEAYLLYFWPYILFGCTCLFTVVDAMVVKRETLLKVGGWIIFAAAIAGVIGLGMGYVFAEDRIRAIGGYETSDKKVLPAIGMNELVVRSVEAVEAESMEKYDKTQTRDIYGLIKQAEARQRRAYLERLYGGLSRVEAMYKPDAGKQTKLVAALGGPDQGLIDCLTEFSNAVNTCIELSPREGKGERKSLKGEFDRAWQKANLCNRKFFERARELGVYNNGI